MSLMSDSGGWSTQCISDTLFDRKQHVSQTQPCVFKTGKLTYVKSSIYRLFTVDMHDERRPVCETS